jgi:ADP-heptose:LPS heptosyltransferase
MQRLGARVTAGLQAADAPPLDRNLPYRLLHPEVLRLLEAVSLVGAQGCDVEPRLAVTPADRREADGALAPTDERPLVVLQPGCTDPRRAWPAEAFAQVGDVCARRGARVVLNGTQDEAPRLAAVRSAMREPCLNLAGVLSLGGLLGLLERARLVVANDTGPAHLARALDVPSVTLYWICNLAPYVPMSTLRHAVAVSWQLHCPRCGRFNIGTRCEHDDSFMEQLRPEEVLSLVDSLWPACA